jgi:hypothetical protein
MQSLRDIEAGEELTVPYYHPTHLVSLRVLITIEFNSYFTSLLTTGTELRRRASAGRGTVPESCSGVMLRGTLTIWCCREVMYSNRYVDPC